MSIPTSYSERERDAFAGLAQVQGMSYSEFRDLLFGEGERKWSGNKGLFNYEAIATGSAKSGTRKITFSGLSDTDRGQTESGRKVVLNIQVTGDRISLNVTQMRKGFFGWKTVYQGACTGLKKIALIPQESEESLGEQNGAELTAISEIRFKAPRESATRSRSATGNNKPSTSIAAL